MQRTKVLKAIQDLSYFSEGPDDITIDKVVSQCAIDATMTASIIQKLEQMKLVTISNNIVHLTEKGKTTITVL